MAKKLIRLTEADIEKLVQKVLSEQESYDVKSKRPPNQGTQKFEFGKVFPSGRYEIKNTSELDKKISQIKSFISQYPENQKFRITINAGESRVTNQSPFEEPLSLANARAEELMNILDKKLSDSKVDIEYKDPVLKLGSTPYDKKLNAGEKDDEKYTKEQFVNVMIDAVGESTAPKRKVVPMPLLAGSPNPSNGKGIKHWYVQFMDGTTYRFNYSDVLDIDKKGKSTEEIRSLLETLPETNREMLSLLIKKLGGGDFRRWQGDRQSLYKTCVGLGGQTRIGSKGSESPDVWCYKLPVPKISEMIPVTNEKIVDQMVQKMRNEKLEFPTTEKGNTIKK